MVVVRIEGVRFSPSALNYWRITWGLTVVIIFITPLVRNYRKSDLSKLIKVYQSAFAEPPWNESWTPEEIKQDLNLAFSEKEPIVLVAEVDKTLAGFVWGYKLPLEKFSWLLGVIDGNVNYMDEIAVGGDRRIKGIGTRLGVEYLELVRRKNMTGVALRTDIWNSASMALFRKLGFQNTGIFDPKYKSRIYLYKELT